ncbi:MAG: hypothetical protein KF723_11675 [Rhizobiaceae bacterium]|nr:hypothetical protein [Rhizobiaceae bacterium]
MGELIMAAPVAGLIETGRILDGDVTMLRREVFADGVVSRGEAEALFALHASCQEKAETWPAFLIEAICDYLVHQEKPQGYISEENAVWLRRAISRGATVDGETEMELLVSVLERARSAPVGLVKYALEQVAFAVIDGAGPLAPARCAVSGVVEKHEVDWLRRILHAFGGNGNIAITREEAEVLFRINDGTCEEMNDPSWNELFVKAIANFVLNASGYEPPSRADALRRDAFFEKADADIGAFFSRMVSGGVAGILTAYEAPERTVEDHFAEQNRVVEAKRRVAASVRAEEARWLAERITHDRLIHDNERALLTFIKGAATSVHPDLKPLLNKVA